MFYLQIYQGASKMIRNSFMRLIVIFDLPTITKAEVKQYRQFVDYLTKEGFLRIQYSVYSKLCINNDSARTASKKLMINTPSKGDVRYIVITEKQYQRIVNVNGTYTMQESITTTDRTVMIGGMNDENSQ